MSRVDEKTVSGEGQVLTKGREEGATTGKGQVGKKEKVKMVLPGYHQRGTMSPYPTTCI